MCSKTVAALAIVAVISAPVNISVQAQNSADKVEKTGGKVTPPHAIYFPEPEFSDQARRANYQGVCTLSMIIGTDGKPSNVKVVNGLGMGLDEKAVEAVRRWRFDPARKDGHAVPVQIAVEIDFHLLNNLPSKIDQLRKKAEAGDAKSELDLAHAYFEGRITPKDESQGLKFLQKAANHGLPKAQFQMGERLGHDASPDYPTAYMWYELALRNGYKQSDSALKQLASKMNDEQLKAGQGLVENWKPTP